ncbi:MAG: DMT family transporter [Clostridia bacterium]|nr:DMT family transporter [Clostridia bacterium]
MSKTLKATVAGLLGYSIYGFSFLFAKVALNVSHPDVLLSVRFIIAFLVLNLFLLTKKFRISFKGKAVAKLLMMGFIQPVVYFICEARGIALTSTSFSGIIIGLSPVVGIIFGFIFLKEKYSVFQIICTVMSVIGVVLTTASSSDGFSITGCLLLLVSVISTTAFSALSRSISEEFSPFERSYAMTGMGAIAFTCVALVTTKGDFTLWKEPLTSPQFLGSVFYLALISSVGAFMLINYALNYLSIGHTLIFSNFTTVISVLLGFFIMKDSFTAVQLTGMIIIILSVFAVSVYKAKKDKGNRC